MSIADNATQVPTTQAMGNFNRGFFGEHLQGLPLQACIALCSAFSFTLFGYDQGVFGGLIATPILLHDLKISASDANLQGTVVAIYDIGCLIGCFICAFLGQKLGRRVYIVIGGVLLIIGAGMQAGAHSYKLVIAGRLIGGIGTGLETTFVPIWVAECARASRRGALIAAQLTVVILGLDIAYWFDFGVTTNLHGSIQWRLPVAFQVVFVVLTWIMIPFLPESPRYLYANGHNADADEVISRIYKVPVTSQTVDSHRKDVIAALEAERNIKFGFKDFFMPWTDKSPINTSWRIWLGIAIQFFQQADGNNIVSYYATYLLIHSAGMSQHQASITAAGVVLIFVAGTATGIYTVERFGRRPVLLYGAVACSFFMILFTIGLAVNTKHSTIMAVVSIFLFEFVFGGSWCFMPWVYAPEISPLHVRHIGTSLAVGTEWLVTFILVKWGPLGISTIHWKFYLIFCIATPIAGVFTFFFVKETKGLSLEEIDVLFAKPAHKAQLEARLRGAEYASSEEKGTGEVIEQTEAPSKA